VLASARARALLRAPETARRRAQPLSSRRQQPSPSTRTASRRLGARGTRAPRPVAAYAAAANLPAARSSPPPPHAHALLPPGMHLRAPRRSPRPARPARPRRAPSGRFLTHALTSAAPPLREARTQHDSERGRPQATSNAAGLLQAALERCGACLWGSCASARLLGLGAAVRGAGRRAALLRRAVALFALALAARALWHRVSRSREGGEGWKAAGVGARCALGSACAALP
jgi:hypothetical protein